MRHEDCLTCRVPGVADPRLVASVTLAESVTGHMHHHHTIRCERCRTWWFDDIAVGGFGPLPSRRDTVMCPCPEGAGFAQTVALVPEPEADCHCTAADVDKNAMSIRMDGAR